MVLYKGGEVSGEWMLCWNHMRDTLTVEFVFNRRHERTTAMYWTECYRKEEDKKAILRWY